MLRSTSNGFITLLSVLIVGIIGLATALSLLFVGIGSSGSSVAVERENQAKALASACAETALEQIHDSTGFTGNGGFSSGAGSCAYSVASQGGQNRVIHATGTVATVVRKINITIDRITPRINVISWDEVPD